MRGCRSELHYLLFEVANVAQIKSDHFNDGEEDHPGYEQGLVVARQMVELQRDEAELCLNHGEGKP